MNWKIMVKLQTGVERDTSPELPGMTLIDEEGEL